MEEGARQHESTVYKMVRNRFYSMTHSQLRYQLYFHVTTRFVGGELNACYNTVDRHVLAGKGGKVALIHNSPVTNTIRKVTYKELQDKVYI